MDEKCKFPDGITVKPDGVNELDPCVYEVIEIHKNVTVAIMKCINCGYEDMVWYSQPNSEHIFEVSEDDEDYLENLMDEEEKEE